MSLSSTLDPGFDGELRLVFTVTNDGEEPVELRFRDGQRAEFAVYEDGEERWRFGDGRAFTQALSAERLGPGKSVGYECRWAGIEPGDYTARAWLCADGEDCVAERTFELSGETLSSDPP